MRDAHQEAVGARIAKLREQQGWSQRALAKWVGLDQSAVSRIEAGSRRLSADELQRFAHAFHVSADDLLRTAVPSASPAAAERAPGSRSTDRRFRSTSTPPRTRDRPLPEPADSTAAPADECRTPGGEPEPEMTAAFLSRLSSMRACPMARMAAPGGPAPDEAAMLSRDGRRRRVPRCRRAGRDAPGPPSVPGLPEAVAARGSRLVRAAAACRGPRPAQRWSTGHSAEGKPERIAHPSAALRPGAHAGDVLYDRVARFWRSELHVEPDDGPLPDLVPLLEDGYGAQVIVARVAGTERRRPAGAEGATLRPAPHPSVRSRPRSAWTACRSSSSTPPARWCCSGSRWRTRSRTTCSATATSWTTAIEWSRNVPPEAAANDFAEEFLAPVRAVQRWYERRDVPRYVRVEDLLELANAFGISVWSALFRSRAAGRLHGKQFHVLRSELRRDEWALLPRQAFLGGLRDTLSHLTPDEPCPRASSEGRPCCASRPPCAPGCSPWCRRAA